MNCDKTKCHYYDETMTDNCSKGEPPNVEKCENRKVISWCPQCGPNPGCDEDGCCGACGCDVGEIPDYIAIQKERDEALARAEKAEADLKINAHLLAQQTDMAREAEIAQMKAEAEVKRWKHAVMTYERAVPTPYGALEAMRDGDLDALERALKIKE